MELELGWLAKPSWGGRRTELASFSRVCSLNQVPPRRLPSDNRPLCEHQPLTGRCLPLCRFLPCNSANWQGWFHRIQLADWPHPEPVGDLRWIRACWCPEWRSPRKQPSRESEGLLLSVSSNALTGCGGCGAGSLPNPRPTLGPCHATRGWEFLSLECGSLRAQQKGAGLLQQAPAGASFGVHSELSCPLMSEGEAGSKGDPAGGPTGKTKDKVSSGLRVWSPYQDWCSGLPYLGGSPQPGVLHLAS